MKYRRAMMMPKRRLGALKVGNGNMREVGGHRKNPSTPLTIAARKEHAPAVPGRAMKAPLKEI
jgi:hypothetical protein